jgi:hypothetical protein
LSITSGSILKGKRKEKRKILHSNKKNIRETIINLICLANTFFVIFLLQNANLEIMKKYIFIFTFLYIQCFSQENIKLSHASQYDDYIELELEMDKPTSKFDLINLDTLTVTDNKKNVLKENKDNFFELWLQ